MADGRAGSIYQTDKITLQNDVREAVGVVRKGGIVSEIKGFPLTVALGIAIA